MLNLGALTLANIGWLLAAMAFVIAPHVTRLPLWVTACCLAAGAWRWWIARRGLRAPPWWMMALIAIGITAGARLEYGRLFGRDVGVTLLIVMLCLKILEMKMKRDAMLAIFLGFFLALTNFLYSQTILMGAYMFICVWIFVATLIGFQRINTEATVRERIVPSAWLMLQAIPMMLVLFFLFPRISGPLWNMPSDEQASSGLSDRMAPGDISKLSLSDAVAFRVDFENTVPSGNELYWRGPVLGRQRGKAWVPYPVQIRNQADYEPQGPVVNYRVTLQPNNKYWLFALDLPTAPPPDAFMLADYQIRSRTPVSALKSYLMSSHLQYRAGRTLGDSERHAYLEYDRSLNPRTIAYGQKLAQENPDPKVLVTNLLKLYNATFSYTLEPPLLGDNPMDEFLFDTRQGFCEHYAGSFVLLLRAAGVPARVVTGYQGGEINPITRQLVVRQSDAHAWSEVWFDDLGWVRVDPTFAVSPLRINGGIEAALGPVGVFNTLMSADQLGVLKRIRFSWDALNNQWNQWVVGFNADRQRGMLDGLGLQNADWRSIAVLLIVGVTVAGGSVGGFLLLRVYRSRKEPLVAAWDRLCAKLARAGFARAPQEGPMDLLNRIDATDPALAAEARPVIERYVALRYGAPPAASTAGGGLREFIRQVRRLRLA
ncbi:MAG TPA: DUF3488 and transglutaminase-like domain-containing protein [Usitatibacteraceae bacterium]